jgi:hypothetical protein
LKFYKPGKAANTSPASCLLWRLQDTGMMESRFVFAAFWRITFFAFYPFYKGYPEALVLEYDKNTSWVHMPVNVRNTVGKMHMGEGC